jgi:TolB-like protein/tetratricopeptide (TPR) repeat protein
MFTDIAGYTAMMQENEKEAMSKRDRQRVILEECVPLHNGKILQTFGDGTLCVFSSAIEAVSCAVKVQVKLQAEPVVPLRVGIHIGDVVYDDREIYGDGVNVASRIESISVAGAVLVSEKVYDDIKNQPYLPAVSIGSFEFKNVSRPVEVFALTAEGLKIPEAAQINGKLKRKEEVVAVLPFANMSADPENEYFSDGISEEILNALTRVEGLQVVARTSSFSFKGRNEDMREIGRKLNASALIEGSVRKAGNRVRITAQLINTADGTHYWSETYDRELKDIFEIQDEISLDIAHKLQQQFKNVHTPEHLVKTSTSSFEAYDIYLKTMYMLNHDPTDETNMRAIQNLEEAVKLDPSFARAYSTIASCYIIRGSWNAIPPAEAFPKAKQYIDKALELDKNDYSVYLAYGEYKRYYEWDWEGAKSLVLKAMELNPGSADAWSDYSMYMRRLDLNKAIKYALKAVELDPLSINHLNMLANTYVEAGKFDKAGEVFNKALIINPASVLTKQQYVLYFIEMGNYEEAYGLLSEWGKTNSYWLEDSNFLALIYMNTGREDEAYAMLKRCKMNAEKNGEQKYLWKLACLYSITGDKDNAIKYLNMAADIRLGAVIMAKYATSFRNLKTDERFNVFLRRIGMEG